MSKGYEQMALENLELFSMYNLNYADTECNKFLSSIHVLYLILYVQEVVILQKRYLIYLHQKNNKCHLSTITILQVEYFSFTEQNNFRSHEFNWIKQFDSLFWVGSQLPGHTVHSQPRILMFFTISESNTNNVQGYYSFKG